MAGFRDEDDIDDVLAPKEPQVTSSDPSERKAARFLRIKRRQEAIKRAEAPPEEALAFEEPGAIELATTFAAEELQRLALEGAAKVTNVKVTTDEREVVRRRLLADNTEKSLKKIEEEAIEAQTQYEIITGNWEAMMAIRDPLDIDYAMKEQKNKCDELLNQKNVLLEELKADLKKMDEDYYVDLQKQDNDIKELSDRVEKQITIMLRAYEKQIMLIEAAINIEREAMLDHNNKRWEALFKQRDKEELIQMEMRFDQEAEHKEEVEAIMWDHFNKYREAKIELEKLTQELQKELEKLKATCIINTEKIGYNYQVLKKREEENVFVRSQQKRKLNKMSDVANILRNKIRKAAEDGAIEEKKADAEIVKLMQTMEDLEKKSDQFSHVNHYKFSQVWRMAATHLQETSRNIRLGEIALHAHVLSEPPPPPPPPPPKSPLAKYEHEAEQQATEEIALVAAGKETSEAKDKLVRHILQLVADNTGFLVEDRLLRLISKYQLTSRNLCTLDAIFMALEIQAEEDIELLCKTFLNYAFCPICIGMGTSETAVGSNMDQSGTLGGESDDMHRASVYSRSRGDPASIRGRASIVTRSMSASTFRSHVVYRGELSDADQQLITEAEEIIQKVGDPQASRFVTTSTTDATASKKSTRGVTLTEQQDNVETEQKVTNPFLCPAGHNLEIEAVQVLTALGEFIKMFVPPEKRKLYDLLDSVKPPNFSTPSRKMASSEIEQYWAQWKNLFPPEKDKFWDGLLTGLNNYLPILQERERLHEEVMHLRQRNAALRRLVRGALPDIPSALTVPKYARESHEAFLASYPDNAPEGYKLPPI